ncbi:MAG: hypothetical protein U0174_27290 [Polyangiaceae bacterium]
MRFPLLSASALFVLLACSSTSTGSSGDAGARPTCDMLAEHCHEATSAEGKKCHDLGHSDATEDACKSASEGCMKVCEHTDHDAATDAPVEAAADGGSDAVTCKAIGAECTDSSECCSKDCHAHGGPKKCE